MVSLRPLLGYFVLAGMIAMWITMSELLQNLQVGYKKPLFITIVVHGSYGWFLIPWALLWCHARSSGHNVSLVYRYGLSPRKLILMGLVSSLLGSFCAYAWYLSLSHTTVAANNSIYQSCAAIVYVFSVIWLKEKVTLLKTVAVLVSIGGVVLVSVSTPSSSDSSIHTTAMGYFWLMASVVAYAIYEVIQKQFLNHESSPVLPSETPLVVFEGEAYSEDVVAKKPVVQDTVLVKAELTCLMLGTYGLFLNVMAAPIVLLWDKTGVETFELPSHSKASMLMLNAGFDSIYNVLLLFGILITSPLFISVGSMLVMPASIVTDRLIHGTVMGPVGVCGAIVIVIGFSLLNIPQEDASRWMKRKCGRNRGGQDPLLTYAEF